MYPERIEYKASSGGTKLYRTIQLELVKRENAEKFEMPPTEDLPTDTKFDDTKDTAVKVVG